MPLPPQGNQNRVITGATKASGRRAEDSEFRKMPRQPGSGRRRRSRSRSGNRRGGSPVLQRLIILGLSVAGLGLAGMLAFTFLAPPPPSGDVVRGGSGAALKPDVPRPTSEESIAMVRRLLSAGDPGEIAALIHPGEMTAAEAFDFIQALPRRNLEPVWIGSVDSLAQPIEALFVRPDAGTSYIAFLTPDENHDWKIDFDAFARHSEGTMEQLLDGRIDSLAKRFLASRDFYHNSIYLNDEDWICHALKDPDSDTVIYGYCRNGSPQARALESIAKQSVGLLSGQGVEPTGDGGALRVTLRIEREPGAGPRQFRITSVIADEWVIGSWPIDQLPVFQTSAASTATGS